MADSKTTITPDSAVKLIKAIDNPIAGIYIAAGTTGTVEQIGRHTVRVRFDRAQHGISVDTADIEPVSIESYARHLCTRCKRIAMLPPDASMVCGCGGFLALEA